MLIRPRRRQLTVLGGVIGAATACLLVTAGISAAQAPHSPKATATPIKHVVVIFDENISYDHYFGTYPVAANTDGTTFKASKNTPANNNLISSGYLDTNPNLYPPTRLTSSQVQTCDQNHNYQPEQLAEANGAMNQFVQNVSVDKCTGLYGAPGLSMDYYDGNTVTGLWNYAQQFALSDNSYDTTFGPSTPGALNLVSGQTHGFQAVTSVTHDPTSDAYAIVAPDSKGVGTIINDPDPAFDDCADSNHTSTNNLAAAKTGKNIGDLLNQQGTTWGWFQGGFKPSQPATKTAGAVCGAAHTNVSGTSVVDYSAHHNPFEYYKSTSNPKHLPPSSVKKIGQTDQANHEYDLSDFNTAIAAGVMPSVSFLKAPEYQDGHAGYSDPIDEQNFLVSEINAIQKSSFWSSTAIVIAYDDSDGWYDHAFGGISNGATDTANNSAMCLAAATNKKIGVLAGDDDRCGPGPRLPLLVISPYAKTNYVDHTRTEQTSVLKFIEDNWHTGAIGNGSFDKTAGSLTGMFDFAHPNNKQVLLKSNGTISSIKPIGPTHH